MAIFSIGAIFVVGAGPVVAGAFALSYMIQFSTC